MRRQSRQVVGVMIHVMAPAGLGGAAVTSSVMGDDAIAVLEEEQHLRVPIIGRQRPAMAEHDGRTFAPILVEDLNAVLGGDRAHGVFPYPKLMLRVCAEHAFVECPRVRLLCQST